MYDLIKIATTIKEVEDRKRIEREQQYLTGKEINQNNIPISDKYVPPTENDQLNEKFD